MTGHAANVSILYPGVPVLERARRAHDDGFAAIESWWPFPTAGPSDTEVDAFVASVADAGVELVAMNTFGGDLAAGERGIASVPHRRAEFDDSLAVALEVGRRLGTTMFNTLVGTGPLRDLAVDRLALAATTAQREGRRILVEPLSGVDDYPITTAGDAFALAGTLGRGAGVLGDLYHLAVNGEDLDAVIARHADRIAHVQLADAPGRHEPGTGELDFAHLLTALHTAGYRGRTALEYVPTRPDFAWLGEEDA
jgi:hydroxypyruvate isomerase